MVSRRPWWNHWDPGWMSRPMIVGEVMWNPMKNVIQKRTGYIIYTYTYMYIIYTCMCMYVYNIYIIHIYICMYIKIIYYVCMCELLPSIFLETHPRWHGPFFQNGSLVTTQSRFSPSLNSGSSSWRSLVI